MKKFFIGITAVLLIIFASSAAAYEFSAENNGDGSTNSINFNFTNQTTVDQSNQMDVSNDIDASSNTGGNSASGGQGGSITTGDATTIVDVDNNFNSNNAQVDCCPGDPTPTPKGGVKPTPTPVAGQPTPTPVPGQPTPTPKSGDGGGGVGGGNGGGGVGGGEVLGLSVTASETEWETLLYTASAGLVLLARKLLRPSVGA